MAKYNASIDGDQGGRTIIVADGIAEALREAIDWAADGDWDQARPGCVVEVRVWPVEDGSDRVTRADWKRVKVA